jgi:hypothetical protein
LCLLQNNYKKDDRAKDVREISDDLNQGFSIGVPWNPNVPREIMIEKNKHHAPHGASAHSELPTPLAIPLEVF